MLQKFVFIGEIHTAGTAAQILFDLVLTQQPEEFVVDDHDVIAEGKFVTECLWAFAAFDHFRCVVGRVVLFELIALLEASFADFTRKTEYFFFFGDF